MFHRCILIALMAPVLLVGGCKSCLLCGSSPSDGEIATARNQGYALLYSTIDDESKVDKVLMIKGPSPQVTDLIKAIAQFSRETRDGLDAFAKTDSTLGLQNDGLPAVETATRDAISGATAKQIVFSGGREFEFNILMTQHEALNYITHLAGALGEQETDATRKQYLSKVTKDSIALHERVIVQLKSPYVGPAK